MWNSVSVMGKMNVKYMKVKSVTDTSEGFEEFPSTAEAPVWDEDTIALANFNGNIAASNFEGGDVSCDYYRIYRIDEVDNSVKYIATVSNTEDNSKKIKDYCVSSKAQYHYLLYPITDDGVSGSPVISHSVNSNHRYWSVTGLKPTEEEGVYNVDSDNIWKFIISPEIGDISQAFNKSIRTGFKRYPVITGSKVNYTTLSVTILLGDISCETKEYGNDSVKIKNKWNEFANSSCLKLFTDPKGECMIGDITSTSSRVDYSLTGMPTTLSFEFTETKSTDNISVYGEVEENVSD